MASVASKDTFKYFAYGSNLLRERILINNPTAKLYGIGKLSGYRFGFDAPKGERLDRWLGSGATIFKADPSSYVYGVIWDMNYSDLKSLDRQEGCYNAIQVDVKVVSRIAPPGQQESADGADVGEHTVQCRTYQLKNVTGANLPSPHYKEVILMGARQNRLPQDYIAFLEAFPDNQVKETPIAYKKVMEMLERMRQDNDQ
ncbi:gamma-glutamylcyclotransferase [Plakobranchus ocellatus]|uniref:gamma-glutamylcyclotransferase n=1 Tax=Plakobranchus ocellatus TaxID=259542 RepID=A0AAV4C108_9GAST|nr:gamma-glutamylcyclotransferase [Plakobranchus ocellatus]